MAEVTCGKNGEHVLPEGEDSWMSERCDVLVAAALDRCRSCQERLIKEVSGTLTDDFGRLFTSWAFLHVRMAPVIRRASLADLLGPLTLHTISKPAVRALQGVRVETYGGGFSLDAAGASRRMTAMDASERRAILNDVLDGIVGEIALSGRSVSRP